MIVLNKADTLPPEDVEARAGEVRALAPDVPTYAVSCHQPDTLEPLRQHLGFGRTGALLGSSGVGKSTIVNRLVGHDVLRTQDVRDADSKGRHTSTNRQLVLLPGGGLLIDTPGMRELQLWDTGSLTETFTDVAALAGACRFRDCRHRGEPGCAVVAAVAAGELPEHRLDSYRKLAAEQEHTERQQDARALLDEKRKGRIRRQGAAETPARQGAAVASSAAARPPFAGCLTPPRGGSRNVSTRWLSPQLPRF